MELDVIKTKDNVIICCHDMYIGRLTGEHHAKVSDLNYDELPAFLKQIQNADDLTWYTQTEKDDATWLKLETLF